MYVDELEEKLRLAEECLCEQIRKTDELVYQRDEASRRANKAERRLETLRRFALDPAWLAAGCALGVAIAVDAD
jgi:hypothetical protein